MLPIRVIEEYCIVLLNKEKIICCSQEADVYIMLIFQQNITCS